MTSDHAANLRRGHQAASARRKQKLSAKSLPLEPAIHGQSRQAETRHVVARHPRRTISGVARKANRSGAETIEAKEGFVVGIVDRKKCLRATQFVALAGIPAQEFIQCFFAAVEGLPIMSSCQ